MANKKLHGTFYANLYQEKVDLTASNTYLLQHFTLHRLYIPLPIHENETTKISSDFTIITDKEVGRNRPDMVVWNEREKSATIIDFTVHLDYNIQKTYGEKISKYKEQARQKPDMW